MTLHQRRRDVAVGQESLRAVGVADDLLEQGGPLRDAGLDVVPLAGVDDEGQQVERPGPWRTFVGVDGVGHAVLVDLACDHFETSVEVGEAVVPEQFEEAAPRVAQHAITAAQFVEVSFARRQRQPVGHRGRVVEVFGRKER